MGPQTTDNANDEITNLSSIKTPDQNTGHVSQISSQDQNQNELSQTIANKPSNTIHEENPPVNSIGIGNESAKESKVKEFLNRNKGDMPQTFNQINSLGQDVPNNAEEKIENISQRQEPIEKPEVPTSLNEQNVSEKTILPDEKNTSKNGLPPLPPLPKNEEQKPVEGNKEASTNQKSDKKDGSKSATIIIVLFICVAILALGGFLIYKNRSDQEEITTFEQCVSAQGSTVNEAYPPVCTSADGYKFTAEVPEEEVKPTVETNLPKITEENLTDEERAKECYEEVSNIECAEGTQCMTNPASSFCECMGGQVEIGDSDDGGQYGICLIKGTEYDEWDYFRINTPKDATDKESTNDLGSGSEPEESPFADISKMNYLVENSEGTCTADSQCVWENQGCGENHGVCTNNPDKYAGVETTCEVDPDFPSNLGYTCGCIETIGKCGWEK